MGKLALGLLLALGFAATSALSLPKYRISPRACPSFTTKPDFEVVPYLGEWFEQKTFPSPFQDHFSCVRARYSPLDDGTVEVYNVATNLDGEPEVILGYAYQANPEAEPGMLSVVFPGTPGGMYAVLDTDYVNYAAVYSCQDLGPLYLEFAWVLAREVNATQEVVDEALSKFEQFQIDISKFYDTQHPASCVYDP
ncbi:unnamed protein product [Notodromas monacha]|uniref:Apolipoprotein D n=1 Tax=Notodromas monacha TaxID=399045 RepID=A0A7R9BXC3_9CRUS|nr:unnamed protein product [Notodromas monacha]CAG0922393.1 unnamed protein product [Notodromas monacha]